MSDIKRFALVTGASSGIGAAYAERLAERGFDLILVARRVDRLEHLAERLRKTHGRTIEVEKADLGDSSDLARIESLLRDRDDIEMLVNNAGLGASGASVAVDADAVENLIKINVVALSRLCLAVTPRFAAKDRGVIVNIGSVIAVIPSATAAAYSGSKAYVNNFSRSLQAEFSKTNVKVQLVMPGPVRTEFFGDKLPPFPEELFMSAEVLVDAALSALDQGELICWPTLHDLPVWTTFDNARRELSKAISRTGVPAARYGVTVRESGA